MRKTPRAFLALWISSLALTAPAGLALAGPALEGLRGAAGKGNGAPLPAEGARALSGEGFDLPDDAPSFSPPVLPPPAGPSLGRGRGSLIVGEPGRASIPDIANPLGKDGRPKEAKTGHQWAWAAGGAVLGAVAGWLIGGPWGALIGAVALGAAGYFLGP